MRSFRVTIFRGEDLPPQLVSGRPQVDSQVSRLAHPWLQLAEDLVDLPLRQQHPEAWLVLRQVA